MNTLSLWDGDDDAIGGVEDNSKRQLSAGYAYTVRMQPGTYEGQHYDGVMTDIVGNHLITTATGRAGPAVSVGDSADELHWAVLELALKAKYKTPAAAMNALGLDADLLITKGNPPMTTLSPVALKVRKACVTALRPAMAMDAVVDITPAFSDIQRLDQRSRQMLEQRLCKLVNGKIKPSLAMDDVSAGLRALLEALGGAGPPAAQDAPLETDVGGMPTSMREQDVPTDNVEGAGLPSGALQAGGPGEGQDAPPMPDEGAPPPDADADGGAPPDAGGAAAAPGGEGSGPIEAVRSFLTAVLNPGQLQHLEVLISQIDKGAGGEPAPTQLQPGGTEPGGPP